MGFEKESCCISVSEGMLLDLMEMLHNVIIRT